LLELPPPQPGKYRITPVRSTEACNFLILPPTRRKCTTWRKTRRCH
jgi:hypothetical protein